jgi:transposase
MAIDCCLCYQKSMKTLSNDLRERIVASYDRGDGTRAQIAARYDVSEGMVKKLLQQRRRTGDLAPRHRFSGAKPKITPAHQQHLRRLIRESPDMTLEELRDAIGVMCTPQAVHYVLQKRGLPLKKRRFDRPI